MSYVSLITPLAVLGNCCIQHLYKISDKIIALKWSSWVTFSIKINGLLSTFLKTLSAIILHPFAKKCSSYIKTKRNQIKTKIRLSCFIYLRVYNIFCLSYRYKESHKQFKYKIIIFNLFKNLIALILCSLEKFLSFLILRKFRFVKFLSKLLN